MFTRTLHWTLSWARWIQSTHSQSYYFLDQIILSFHLHSGLPSCSIQQTYQIKFYTHFSHHPCFYAPLLLQLHHPNIQIHTMQWCRCQIMSLNYTYLNFKTLLGMQLCHFNWMLKYFNVIDVDRDVFCCLEAHHCDPQLAWCCEVVFHDERHQPDPAHSVTCLSKW